MEQASVVCGECRKLVRQKNLQIQTYWRKQEPGLFQEPYEVSVLKAFDKMSHELGEAETCLGPSNQ